MTDLFERFWAAYPRKVGKGAARKAFHKLGPDAEVLDDWLRALEEQKRWRNRWSQLTMPQKKALGLEFIPAWKHPSTWLNGECWSDELQSLNGSQREDVAPHELACQHCGKPAFCVRPRTCGDCWDEHHNPSYLDWKRKRYEALKAAGLERRQGEGIREYGQRCRQAALSWMRRNGWDRVAQQLDYEPGADQ